MTLITLQDVHKGFNDVELLRGVSLVVGDGERIGLVGRNGSGKSTLLRILAGVEPPDAGSRVLRRGLRLGYLEQDPALPPEQTAREAVRAALGEREGVLAALDELHRLLAAPGDADVDALLARQARLEHELEQVGGYEVEHRVESTMHALGLEDFDAACGRLSGGERRRVALARLLLEQPDLLLLDEPTNHLDAFVTEWLEDWFLETRTPLLLVTHDRYFLDRVVDRIVELDRGRAFAYAGGYHEYVAARAARLDVEGREESSRLILLRREAEWMRRGPPARTTKAKARIGRFEDLVAAAPIVSAADLEYAFAPGPRLGARVLKLTGVWKELGGRRVVPPLDIELEPGMRLGVVGPNGAGKTTLLKLLWGTLEPDGGSREIGETVRLMGIDQARSELDLTASVAANVAGKSGVVRVGDHTVRVESFLAKFGFASGAQATPVGRLSGGEQNRVLLAKLLSDGGNVLLLDEPTNDLDLATLRALEEALLAFSGAAVVVSHDRWFLDRVATHVLYLDGAGGARLFHGDVSSLLATLASEREEAATAAAATRASAASPARRKTPEKRRRITPWQEKELGELEERIPVLEASLAEVDERQADPALYKGPRSVLEEVGARRAELEAELAGLYSRWEELEELRSES